jgi:hypothetical protein
MTIEVSAGLLIGAAVAYIGPAIGFIVWVKTEVALIKQTINANKEQRDSDGQKNDRENEEIKTLIRDVSTKLDTTTQMFTRQLYDLNTKITRAEAMAEANNNQHK